MFVSPLFYVLLGSLYIALLSCVLTRGRALVVRTVRRYPRTPQYWGEWGSWMFHTSFFLLVLAVVWGKATGFDGIMTITEGQRVAETRASYDTLQEGMLFDGHHSGYEVQLNRFSAPLQANGMPSDFVSNMTVYDGGRQVLTQDVRVNEYLGYNGVDFYQQDYGWAPHMVVRNPAGEVVSDSAIQMISDDKTASTGVLKVPAFNYTLPGQSKPTQIGAKLVLYPDAQALPQVSGGNALNFSYGRRAPRRPTTPCSRCSSSSATSGSTAGASQDVFTLNTSGMTPYYSGAAAFALPLHQTTTLQPAGGQRRHHHVHRLVPRPAPVLAVPRQEGQRGAAGVHGVRAHHGGPAHQAVPAAIPGAQAQAPRDYPATCRGCPLRGGGAATTSRPRGGADAMTTPRCR